MPEGVADVAIVIVVFFFFFQAEDGIRDVAVTGVQTCALPICYLTLFRLIPLLVYHRKIIATLKKNGRSGFLKKIILVAWSFADRRFAFAEIGRASCRERV